MRAFILAVVVVGGAVAVSGCVTVSDTISEQTGTTAAERCERYRTELDLARAIVTVAAPGSTKAVAAVAAIDRLELLADATCGRNASEAPAGID